jgi:hypothetical protein
VGAWGVRSWVRPVAVVVGVGLAGGVAGCAGGGGASPGAADTAGAVADASVLTGVPGPADDRLLRVPLDGG